MNFNKTTTVICFSAAAVIGWLIHSGGNAEPKSKIAHRPGIPVPAIAGERPLPPLPPANWDDDVAALEALKNDDEKWPAALRIAERLFRRNPQDALRFAQWMRQRWPESSDRHKSDWTVLSPSLHTKDDERLYGLYGFHGLEQLLRDPQSMVEGKEIPWSFLDQAAKQDPSAFLAMVGPYLSGPLAKDIFSCWPSSSLLGGSLMPFSGPLKERLMTEITSGTQSAAALTSWSFLDGIKELDVTEVSSVLKSVLSRQELMNGAVGQAVEGLARRAAAENPVEVAALLEGSGKYREKLLTGLINANVDLSTVQAVLTGDEKARFLIERLDNGARPSQGDIDAAVEAALAGTGEAADKLSKSLLGSLTSGGIDPGQGLRSTLQQPAGPGRDAFVSALVSKWAAVDVVGASSALAAMPPGTLPDDAIGGIIGEIRSDPQAAITWAGRMSDRDNGRQVALKAIEEAPVGLQKDLQAQVDQLWPGK